MAFVLEPGRRFGPVRLRRDRRVLHRQRGNRQKTSTSRMTVRFGLSTWSLPSTLLISTAGSSSAGSPHAPGSSMVRRPRAYPVIEIADTQPVPFPDFDRHVLDRAQLQAVMRERRYAAWRTALSSVAGICLITDTRNGRQYVGKADGAENIRQCGSSCVANRNCSGSSS